MTATELKARLEENLDAVLYPWAGWVTVRLSPVGHEDDDALMMEAEAVDPDGQTWASLHCLRGIADLEEPYQIAIVELSSLVASVAQRCRRRGLQ